MSEYLKGLFDVTLLIIFLQIWSLGQFRRKERLWEWSGWSFFSLLQPSRAAPSIDGKI